MWTQKPTLKQKVNQGSAVLASDHMEDTQSLDFEGGSRASAVGVKGKRANPGGSPFLGRFQHSQPHRSPALSCRQSQK